MFDLICGGPLEILLSQVTNICNEIRKANTAEMRAPTNEQPLLKLT